jgi:hypothetical protein
MLISEYGFLRDFIEGGTRETFDLIDNQSLGFMLLPAENDG